MEPSHGTQLCMAEVTAAKVRQPAAPTLQDLAAVPGLGALIMAAVPLPDRVRLRGLCHAFKTSVDASLLSLQSIGPEDLPALDRWGHSNGDVLTWLASKCPDLQFLEAHTAPGTLPWPCWWKLHVANEAVIHVASHCRHLRSLKLHGCKGLRDTGLRAVAANGSELRHLDVGYCLHVTDAGVLAIAAGCRQLEHLNVGGNGNLADPIIMVAIAAHCPRLRHLDIEGTKLVDKDGVIAIARGCPDLRTLRVGSGILGDDAVVALATRCHSLESLEHEGGSFGERGIAALVANCTLLKKLYLTDTATDQAIRLGPDSCRHLHHLTIASSNITVDALAALAVRCTSLTHLLFPRAAATDAKVSVFAANCPHLEELHLSGYGVTDASVLAVANSCWQLRRLNLVRCGRVTAASMTKLAQRCPGLQDLNLSWSYEGGRILHAVAQHCPDLRSLDVSTQPWSFAHARQEFQRTWKRMQDERSEKDDGLAAVLRNCLRLGTLNLSYQRGLSDAGIKMVGDSCKRLRELDLTGCRRCFMEIRLAAMAPNLGALEVLRAEDCDAVTDVSVVALARHCPHLKDVDVSKCHVGDEGVAALARQCALVRLEAADCRFVTDASMTVIGAHCSQLDQLNISYCRRVTTAGVMAVASGCKVLTSLNIVHCSVTASDVLDVMEAYPYLEYVVGARIDDRVVDRE